jgi:creatinine amidohydrolase
MATTTPLRSVHWGKLRRGEIADAAQQRAMVLLPTGAIEQHGPHLPLDTDSATAWELCVRAAEAVREECPTLVLPPLWWGLSPYWMGFPGTITLRPEVLIEVVADVCSSVARHGFSRLIIVNGHGGNDGLLQGAVVKASTAAFRIASLSYWALLPDVLREVTERDHGLIGHAGELETSIQLFLAPDAVNMSAVSADQCASIPLERRAPVARLAVYEPPDPEGDAPQGVFGYAPAASAAKGKQVVTTAAERLANFIRSFRG